MKALRATITPAQSATLGMVLIFGCLAVLGLSVNLGPWVSELVGWALFASILLSLTAYAFERRVSSAGHARAP